MAGGHRGDRREQEEPRLRKSSGFLVVQPGIHTRACGGRTVGRALVAAAVVVLAVDGGTYGLVGRHSLAIAVWWLIALGVGFGILRLPARRSPQGITGAFLASFALLVGVSVIWAANAEAAFLEFDRAALYVGVFALAALSAPRVGLCAWCDGFAIGVSAVTALALASRFYPSQLASHDLPRFLPGSADRLSYPVDYWNGLGVLLAIGIPMLLRLAVVASRAAWRGLAAAALPAVAAAIYLTASRGGTATAILATAVFIALAADRWAALQAACAALLGSTAAILILLDRRELVDGPFGSAAASAQGRTAAVLVALACIVTGVLHGIASGRVHHFPRPRPGVGWATVGFAALLAVVLVAASNPRKQLSAFAQPPTTITLAQNDFVNSHLLSAEGGGRWQFWRAALDQFESRPLLGHGAGSYEAWWAEHGSIPVFVRYAHSLYLEVLGELGLVGIILLLAALGSAVFAGAKAVTRARDPERTTIGALIAGATGFLVAAGIDWMWQLTVVTVVGVACLGLLAASGSKPESGPAPQARRLRALVVFAALVVAVCEILPLLTQIELQRSQEAARRGDTAEARAHALAAARVEPWAAAPHLQLALVDEQRRDLHSARLFIRRALDRDPHGWRLWLVSARIETKLRAIGAAKQSLARAAHLNPRSPLFADRLQHGPALRPRGTRSLEP